MAWESSWNELQHSGRGVSFVIRRLFRMHMISSPEEIWRFILHARPQSTGGSSSLEEWRIFFLSFANMHRNSYKVFIQSVGPTQIIGQAGRTIVNSTARGHHTHTHKEEKVSVWPRNLAGIRSVRHSGGTICWGGMYSKSFLRINCKNLYRSQEWCSNLSPSLRYPPSMRSSTHSVKGQCFVT